MGVEYYLACSDCSEVVDLHKWPVVENAGRFLVHAHYEPGKYPDQLLPEESPYPLVDLASNCKKVLITADDVNGALVGNAPDEAYIEALTPIVRRFAAAHRNHRMFLSCDLGDPEEDPWWPGRPGFAAWFEVPGPFTFNHYLPRNLIDVAGFESWSAVLAGMASDWPFKFAESYPTEIEAIRLAFEERRANRTS